MKILFRADSSSKIGLGHIMRDLVLAKQFKYDEIIFACRSLEGDIINKISYPVHFLESNDIDELIKYILDNNIDMLVIDHYGINYNDEKNIKEKTGIKLFVFDDVYKKHYCDILLNHNIYANKNKYYGLVPPWCELRCGSKYTLIRDEFYKYKNQKQRNNNKTIIFLSMGGSDTYNLNIKILKILNNFLDIEVFVATTDSNKNLIEIKNYVKHKKWIKLYINSENIAMLIYKSDFAIVTASVLLNEVYFLNKDFIAIKVEDNQNFMYKFLKQNNYTVLNSISVKQLILSIKGKFKNECFYHS